MAFIPKFVFIMLMIACCPALLSQYEDKSISAIKISDPPKIDGVLDEFFWSEAPAATGFVIDNPHPGKPLEQNTEVKIAYDDEAIYIGFFSYDESPDSILRQLSGRDQSGNTDYCGITFSCYRDGINGFAFMVTPNGEQYDARMENDGEDLSWNAVWYCKTKINDKGWVAEFKIPFAALRFPESAEQVWNINFVREIRRNRHHAFWRGVDPLVPGILTQMGTLTGIKDVETPKRIFLYPYASSYYNTYEDENGNLNSSFSYNAGLDLKLGLSDAFTMDATLIPDFGQTISDQQILNLSAFEVQFTDNRQFFTEGTELFSKGGLFYSRRIGFESPFRSGLLYSQLKENETIVDQPSKDQIINAIKISGRDKRKLGVGFFNAVTSASLATVQDTITGAQRKIQTSTLTNYNVFVLDQILPNNSFVSLINTSVLRGGEDYDVNVLGSSFELRNKANHFSVSGSGAFNAKYGPAFSQTNTRNDNGFRQDISLNKLSGNFTFNLGQFSMSDTYDPTDLGFLQANNSVGYYLYSEYNIYSPFGRFNRFWSNLSLNYNNLYRPYTFTNFNMNSEGGITTKKFNTYGFILESAPVRGYDYFEPRVWGRVFKTYRYVLGGLWYSSDYRKKVAIDLGVWYSDFENQSRYRFNWRVAPRFRFNDHLFVTYVYSYQSHQADLGFAYAFEDSEGQMPLFGERDVISHTNVLNLKYAFNPVMTLNTRVRHYWGYTEFNKFYTLLQDGELAPSTNSSGNQSFNSFTIDLVYTWIFTPGSELSLVWKNSITDFAADVPERLTEDIDYTFSRPQNNSYSIKLIYFLDYRAVANLANRLVKDI